MYPFREGSFAVKNGWYVAAFGEEVGREPMARTIVGLPVALYRKEDGTAIAVGGRCPHRHFPLGKSYLRGDDIVCGYHGISFGPDGQCTDIPSQDFVPRAYRIPVYPLVEHGMWLWIWPGDPALADPALLPDLDDIGYTAAGMTTHAMFFNEVQCRYQLLNDNLLDLTHLAFLHGTSIGTIDNARVPETLSREPRVLRSRRLIKGGNPPPSISERRGYTGKIDSVIGMDFHLPGFHAGIGDHFEASDGPGIEGEPIQLSRVFHAVTPSTRGSSYYFFGMATPDTAGVPATKQFLEPVIAEDVFASEEIEKMLQLVGGSPEEFMNKSDKTTVEGRRMLQAMMDLEDNPPPRMVSVA